MFIIIQNCMAERVERAKADFTNNTETTYERMNVTLVVSISHTRTHEPSSLVALAMNGMVKKKKSVILF